MRYRFLLRDCNDTNLQFCLIHYWHLVKHICSAGPKGGGGKRAHAPRSDHKTYLAPRKNLMTPKASCKKMVPVRVAHSNPIPTRLQSVKMVGHQ